MALYVQSSTAVTVQTSYLAASSFIGKNELTLNPFSDKKDAFIRIPPSLIPFLLVLIFLQGCSTMSPQDQLINYQNEIDHELNRDKNPYDLSEYAEDRAEALEDLIENGKSREDIADLLKLDGARRKLFLSFGVLVDGLKLEEDFNLIFSILESLPSQHLEGFRAVIAGVRYTRFYDSSAKGRYHPINRGVITFRFNTFDEKQAIKDGKTTDKGKPGVIHRALVLHEIGHFYHFYHYGFFEGALFWLNHLFLSWGDNAFSDDYNDRDFFDRNHWEDFAEMYESWTWNSAYFIQKLNRSAVLRLKAIPMIRQFIIEKRGKYFLRVYKYQRFQDIEIHLEEPDALEFEDLWKLKDNLFQEHDTSMVDPKKQDLHFAATLNWFFFNDLEPVDSSL